MNAVDKIFSQKESKCPLPLQSVTKCDRKLSSDLFGDLFKY